MQMGMVPVPASVYTTAERMRIVAEAAGIPASEEPTILDRCEHTQALR